MDTWVASTFWLLGITLLWTWGHKHLFETLLSTILGTYPEVELLHQMVIWFLTFCGTALLFSLRGFTSLHSHQQCPRPFQDLLFSGFVGSRRIHIYIYPLHPEPPSNLSFHWVICFLLELSCRSSFCILDINPFSYIRFANLLSCRLEVDFIVISI